MSYRMLPPKAATETLDYAVDWSSRLGPSETIQTAAWAVSGTGLTITTSSNDNVATLVWLSGGTVGTLYTLTNTVTTNAGRTMVEKLGLLVES